MSLDDLQRWLCYRLACEKLVCTPPLIPIIEPKVLKLVDFTLVFERLNEVCPSGKIFISDRLYYLTAKEDIQRFLNLDPTDKEKYVAEFFDCDDFSFRMMGQIHVKPWASLAFGIAWSQIHAFNIFIDHKGDVHIVEPQTDQVLAWDQAKNREEYAPLQLIIM